MEVLRGCKFGGGGYVWVHCMTLRRGVLQFGMRGISVRVRTHHLDGEKHISYHQSISVSLDPESRCNYCMRDGH